VVQYLPPFDMDAELERIIGQLHDTVDFEEVDFSDINACSLLGDNGLHCVVGWGDLDAAKILINAGIDVNKAGDLGYTPLHVACMKGKPGDGQASGWKRCRVVCTERRGWTICNSTGQGA
jgi:hypothetical protein